MKKKKTSYPSIHCIKLIVVRENLVDVPVAEYTKLCKAYQIITLTKKKNPFEVVKKKGLGSHYQVDTSLIFCLTVTQIYLVFLFLSPPSRRDKKSDLFQLGLTFICGPRSNAHKWERSDWTRAHISPFSPSSYSIGRTTPMTIAGSPLQIL